MDIKEESLRKALAAVGLSNLPRQYNASSQEFWLKAIVLVRKRNMEESYCLYDRKASGLMELVRDFGSASVIFSVKSIHPYLYFDERRFIPEDRSIEDKRLYLLHELDKDDKDWFNIPTMDEKQLDQVIFEHGISMQLENLDEDIRLNDINEVSEEEQKAITEEDEKKYRSDLFAMIREGRSQEEITSFREAFERRKEAQKAREKENREIGFGDGENSSISDADRLRQQMESEDEARIEQAMPQKSIEGEFDVPKIDYDKLRAETEEYRQEQIRACKRAWKREYDKNQRGESSSDSSFENEAGEIEDVETLQLPEKSQHHSVPTVVTVTAKKRGRPRKTTNNGVTAMRKPTVKKKRVTRAKKA